ncbi:hypothetical protein niasHT_031699 [Heterodera trifolii]|uniref:ShKT domain-containing protein n=1 Tax=Heterodera trifolii TaxID=157864 RepID=A0ABD2IY18_9BILA
MLDRRKGQQPTKIGTGAASAIIAALALCQHLHFVCTEEPQEQQQRNKTALNRIPPSIYTWIEENAHICTIVPANGESLINFLSEEEGAKCALCPELGPHELPGMACAIEVTPNEIDVGIGCHPVPELCLLELKTLYAEFFTSGLPGGMPLGNKNEHRTHSSLEEDIFKATGNLFTSATDGSNSVMEVTSERTDEHLDEEEQEEEEEEDEQEKRREKLGEDTTPTETTNATTMTTSSTTATSATTSATIQPSTTTTSVRANIFARPSPQGFPINLTMEEMHLLSRTSKPQKGWSSLIPPAEAKGGEKTGDEGEEMPMEVKSPANTEPMLMKKRAKGRTGNEVEEEQEVDEELAKESGGPCKDRHELCCFWAMSGECDSNPFWMRTKCPMTCGTCGCKVRNADKCHSIGVKCVSTTTTTTPSTTATTTTSSTTTTTTPTPPPVTSPPSSRRRPRPTPPQMPGHRPQRPRQRSRTSTTTTTTTSSISSMETTTAQNDVDHEESPASVGENGGRGGGNNVGDDNYYDYANNVMPSLLSGTDAERKTISGHSGRRVPEGRIDAESGGPITRPKWLLSSAGPGYEETVKEEEEEDNSVVPSPMNLSSTLPTTTSPPTTITKEICFNFHKLCDFWAKMGECLNNPFWMRPHCQVSCNSCGETLGDISTPPARSGCNNEHILCPFWAFIGECARNPRWMSLNCRASCELC